MQELSRVTRAMKIGNFKYSNNTAYDGWAAFCLYLKIKWKVLKKISSVEQNVNTQMMRNKTLNKSNLKSAKCTSLLESVIALYEYSISKLIRRLLQEF
jgi:hypothetical protein